MTTDPGLADQLGALDEQRFAGRTEQSEARDDGGQPGRIVITREGLRDGSLLARVRANLLPGMTVRSDAEIEASLNAALATHDPTRDVWLFAYGSLMWNPAIRTAGQRCALLRGWHRRFCFSILSGRGSPKHPGLMLGLDSGGACHGIAWRIAAAEVRHELLLVWRREMFGLAYVPRWVNLSTVDGPVRAVTFVANRHFARYCSKLSDAETAARLAVAAGPLGSGAEYLDETLARLRALGLRDSGLERIEALIARHQAAREVACIST